MDIKNQDINLKIYQIINNQDIKDYSGYKGYQLNQ